MDQNDPSRRQYMPQIFTTQPQQQQQGAAPAQGQYTTSSSNERFRHASYLQQSPVSASPVGRGGGEAQQVYGFAQGSQYGAGAAMQPIGMQYAQDIQTPEGQRQQTQQYPQYGSNVMYGMAQTQPGHSPYEQLPQYRSRANAASETLATQLGVPQTTQYYLAGQPSAPAPELATQHLPSQYQSQETYAQGGPSTAQTYSTNLMDPSQAAQAGAYATYAPHYTPPQQPQPNDQGFDRYAAQVRTIFTLARDSSLRDVGQQLLEISHYLLGNSETLGLTRDDEAFHDGRIRLWDEFNRAWLVTLQRQFDLTQEMIQTNQALREPQSIMDVPTLERLCKELVTLCDSVERHGLVDYQMGVSEEEIMELLLRCLALLEPSDQGASEPRQQAESSAAGAARGR